MPSAVRQRKVLLRIKPHVRDTLRMRFDQVVQSSGPAPVGTVAPTRTTATYVHSRSVVERVDDLGAVVRTVTDSARFDSPGSDPKQLEAAREAMRGRWARLRVSSLGGMDLMEAGPQERIGSTEADAFARLPGTLPQEPVAVGTSWTRELTMPFGANTSLGDGGRVRVTFTLDSLGGSGGAVAYVSMSGALARSGTAQRGVHVATSGTMTGRIVVDLKRGWMTDSRATYAMVSTMRAAPGTPKARPMELRVTIMQRLHCEE